MQTNVFWLYYLADKMVNEKRVSGGGRKEAGLVRKVTAFCSRGKFFLCECECMDELVLMNAFLIAVCQYDTSASVLQDKMFTEFVGDC